MLVPNLGRGTPNIPLGAARASIGRSAPCDTPRLLVASGGHAKGCQRQEIGYAALAHVNQCAYYALCVGLFPLAPEPARRSAPRFNRSIPKKKKNVLGFFAGRGHRPRRGERTAMGSDAEEKLEQMASDPRRLAVPADGRRAPHSCDKSGQVSKGGL